MSIRKHTPPPGMLPDWNTLEKRMRSVLQQYGEGIILAIEACRLIDEALAVATRRGNALPNKPFPWEPSYDFKETQAKASLYWEIEPSEEGL